MSTTFQSTGLRPVESNYRNPSHLEAGATAEPEGFAGLLHPDNPMFWLGGIVAVAFGLAGISGGLRIGKGRAKISIGKE